jgi:hypothetical protein
VEVSRFLLIVKGRVESATTLSALSVILDDTKELFEDFHKKLAEYAPTSTNDDESEDSNTAVETAEAEDDGHEGPSPNLSIDELRLELIQKFTDLVNVRPLSLTPSSSELPRTSVRPLSFRRKTKKPLMRSMRKCQWKKMT